MLRNAHRGEERLISFLHTRLEKGLGEVQATIDIDIGAGHE